MILRSTFFSYVNSHAKIFRESHLQDRGMAIQYFMILYERLFLTESRCCCIPTMMMMMIVVVFDTIDSLVYSFLIRFCWSFLRIHSNKKSEKINFQNSWTNGGACRLEEEDGDEGLVASSSSSTSGKSKYTMPDSDLSGSSYSVVKSSDESHKRSWANLFSFGFARRKMRSL